MVNRRVLLRLDTLDFAALLPRSRRLVFASSTFDVPLYDCYQVLIHLWVLAAGILSELRPVNW